MASPADVVPQVNGGLVDPSLASQSNPPSHPDESQPATASAFAGPTAKRKREASNDGDPDLNGADDSIPATNGSQPLRDEKSLIRNYFDVLQRYDTTPSVLKRPLSDPSVEDEPQSKRQKSDDDGAKAISIEDKVNQDAYKLLDQLVLDLKKAIEDRATEMRSAEYADHAKFDDQALIQLNNLKDKALEMHNREMAYPQTAQPSTNDGPGSLDGYVQRPSDDSAVLTIFGNAPHPKHLFSSFKKRHHGDIGDVNGAVKLPPDAQLPPGISMTAILPAPAAPKPARTPTLGDMFPGSANLPPLDVANLTKKTATKGKVLGFYQPELAQRSRYRPDKDTYFSKELTTGIWLDYSNAAPAHRSKDRQRERILGSAAQSPVSVDVDINEIETLFRGAFSSFAPEKDDSGALISSGEVSRIWYQRQGYRYMQQIIDSELLDEDEETNGGFIIGPDDEKQIAETVDTWDDSLVDPNLTVEDVLGKKSDEEKEIDDTLQEISDLIETLSSYQRNRNLTMPGSKNTGSADAAKADMLNGSLAQEPSEEERETYELLRNQLAVIIHSLPPYAVARLNSDKLEELNVSTKIEVRSDVYKGVMEEDEASARIRQQQQQQAQAAQTPRQAQRAPSFHGATPYQASQPYNRQYQMQTQTPVPVPNHYQQSPVRAQVPPQSYQRQVSAPMSGMQSQQYRPTGQPFARPNGWNPQQPMQQVRPYGTPGAMSQYQSTPSQPRMSSSYQQGVPASTPSRYPQGYGGYNPQQAQPGIQPQHHQPTGSFSQHMNGVGQMQQRTMSPQVSQFPVGQNYTPRPAQQQPGIPRPGYGSPVQQQQQQGGHPAGIPRFPSNGVHHNPQQSPVPAGQNAWAQMSPQQRYEHQMQARAQAAGRMNQFNEKIQQNHHAASGNHAVAGLGGIGLGGAPVDYQKLAQMRANMHGGVGQSSPSPRMPASPAPPPGMNGVPQHVPSPSPVGATPSPAPSTNMQPRPPSAVGSHQG